MNFPKVAEDLAELARDNKTIYLRTDPEILDFTDLNSKHKLILCGQKLRFTYEIGKDDLFILIPLLKNSLFLKEIKVIGWNLKNFYTYVLGITQKSLIIESVLIDLKVIEAHAGLPGTAPKTLTEALNRLKALVESKSWAETQMIYKKVSMPLINAVLPHLETSPILDDNQQNRFYAYYELNGQRNGRLKCHQAYKMGFVPHTLGPKEREAYLPPETDQIFMYFDFRYMEVVMLHYLSQDEQLQELLKKEDFYAALYELITKNVCKSPEERKKAKNFFLPVMYGEQAFQLSEKLKINKNMAEVIIQRIQELFPKALSYLQKYEDEVKATKQAKDIFGRVRREFDQAYIARNFAVQSPAAIICQEKLVKLYFALKDITKLAYCVHDGYAVYANKFNWQKVFALGYEVLTKESELCPGLKFKVSCQAGRKLNNLKTIQRKGT